MQEINHRKLIQNHTIEENHLKRHAEKSNIEIVAKISGWRRRELLSAGFGVKSAGESWLNHGGRRRRKIIGITAKPAHGTKPIWQESHASNTKYFGWRDHQSNRRRKQKNRQIGSARQSGNSAGSKLAGAANLTAAAPRQAARKASGEAYGGGWRHHALKSAAAAERSNRRRPGPSQASPANDAPKKSKSQRHIRTLQ